MTGPMLIGLTGHAGAGKDSAAACLLASAWRSIAFADALRVEIAAAWGLDVRLLTERSTKDLSRKPFAAGNGNHRDWIAYISTHGESLTQPRSPRWLMQRWGEFRRSQSVDWWVKHVQVWVQTQRYSNHPGLVITDVRMPNEAHMLRGMGGWLVRVHRPGAGLVAADTVCHQSEGHTALQVDDDIDNSGTLADLNVQVAALVQRLRSREAAGFGAEILNQRSLP